MLGGGPSESDIKSEASRYDTAHDFQVNLSNNIITSGPGRIFPRINYRCSSGKDSARQRKTNGLSRLHLYLSLKPALRLQCNERLNALIKPYAGMLPLYVFLSRHFIIRHFHHHDTPSAVFFTSPKSYHFYSSCKCPFTCPFPVHILYAITKEPHRTSHPNPEPSAHQTLLLHQSHHPPNQVRTYNILLPPPRAATPRCLPPTLPHPAFLSPAAPAPSRSRASRMGMSATTTTLRLQICEREPGRRWRG